MASSDITSRLALTPRLRDLVIVLACAAAQALYLLAAGREGYWASFPLDDAWIYQTYARNLALTGEWAFLPGVPSTGATSVLWTLLLVPGYLLPLDPHIWTHLLGFLALLVAALGAARMFEGASPLVSLAFGLFAALEWHVVWAATSGMETALFTALLVWFWLRLRRHDVNWNWRNGLALGIWGGLLMLARPEGVLALGVTLLFGLFRPDRWRDRLRWGIIAIVGFACFLLPFFGLNYMVSGSVWPNTFYAKQAEYATLWSRSLVIRLLDQAGASFVGAHALLIPGLLVGLWRRIRQRPCDLVGFVPLVWVLLHWMLYAARLPVTYQHARYAIPTVPVILAYGLHDTLYLARPRADRMWVRVASRVWLATIALLFPLILGLLGAPAYARDVTFVEVEMVATAQWLDEHTAPESLIAAHDIGALGYFAPRPLLDLAGLVSPDVIPFIHDEKRLTAYILDRSADYLVIFPRWSPAYMDLVDSACFIPLWSAAEGDTYISLSGLGTMTVYQVGDCEPGG